MTKVVVVCVLLISIAILAITFKIKENIMKKQALSLDSLQNIITDPKFQVKVANACDKAYTIGTGNPGWYSEFTSEDSEKLAINLAGLTSVVAGLSVIALLRDCKLEDIFIDILSDIVSDNIANDDDKILLNLANLSRNAQQPMRERFDKINIFDLLPQDEAEKDMIQIQTSAAILLNGLMS